MNIDDNFELIINSNLKSKDVLEIRSYKKIKDLANGYSNFKRFRNRIMYVENLYEKPSIKNLRIK